MQYDRTVRPKVLNTALNTNKVQYNSNTSPTQENRPNVNTNKHQF